MDIESIVNALRRRQALLNNAISALQQLERDMPRKRGRPRKLIAVEYPRELASRPGYKDDYSINCGAATETNSKPVPA
jgi:hypothetical protein